MIGEIAHISERAAGLREAFDRTFVEARHYDPVETEDFLAIEVGGDPYMLRLAEIAGFFVDKKVSSLPSRVAELSGVAGFRGTMVPVYDLAALLRYPASQSARWMVIAADAPVALAFDAFNGHFRFRRGSIASHAGADSREHVREIVRADAGVHPIVHLPSVIAAIRNRTPDATSKKEH